MDEERVYRPSEYVEQFAHSPAENWQTNVGERGRWRWHNPLKVQHQLIREMLTEMRTEGAEVPGLGSFEGALYMLVEVNPGDVDPYWGGLILHQDAEWGAPLEISRDHIRRTAERVAERDTFFLWDDADDERARSALIGLLNRTRTQDEVVPIPMALAPKPVLETTALTGGRLVGSGGAVTIGAPVEYGDDQHGFISVAHALTDAPDGWGTLAEGARASVIKTNRDWDVALLQCDEDIKWAIPCSSVIRRPAPGRGTVGKFIGQGTGMGSGEVDAVDPILPNYSLESIGIARIYTNRCTSPGDSGAVLINGEAQAMGMAVERTAEGERLQFSAWTWMAGVLDAVDATLPE